MLREIAVERTEMANTAAAGVSRPTATLVFVESVSPQAQSVS
jgi:hypothetical protein